MGWYFSPQSRSELIAELIAPQETERASVKVIAHALRGNVLWSVAEVTAKVEGVHRDLAPAICLNAVAASGVTSRWTSPCTRTTTRARCPIWTLHRSSLPNGVQAFAPTTLGDAHPRLSRHPPQR